MKMCPPMHLGLIIQDLLGVSRVMLLSFSGSIASVHYDNWLDSENPVDKAEYATRVDGADQSLGCSSHLSTPKFKFRR